MVVVVVVVVVGALMMVAVLLVVVVFVLVGLCLECVVFYVVSFSSPWVVRLVFEAFSVLVLCCIKVYLCLCRISHIVFWCFCQKYKLGRSRCVVSLLVVAPFGPWFSSGVLYSHHCLLGPIASIWFPPLLCVFARRRRTRGSWRKMGEVNKGAEGVGRSKVVGWGWEDCSRTV